ncbi:hypothetical protein KUCAC02_010493 [Chaenocephalus aceratus]|uniref:Uncharacterized protein n=1 Tax=Chaenocephalus aceratus TaxID=36190 RepID=A0ACB9W009_CHAAC|nr:hypothetical protein KUCAC02_010493 [Chaenocephalus aceratus]
MAIGSILHQVEKHRLKSVAIPAISSGLFNFPLPECADTIVAAVKCYYESSQSHLPLEIRLANHDDSTVSEMERACLQLLGPSSSFSKVATRSQTPNVQIGKVHLTLKKGNIEEQLTDVIVNTTSPERDLKMGEISNALLQKAGRYQQNTTPRQVLYDSVTDCLQNASKNGYKSIAFPAIGTGKLGFDKKEVAAIMADAVVDFAHSCQTEIDVMFIIYPSDDQTYKAFEDQM